MFIRIVERSMESLEFCLRFDQRILFADNLLAVCVQYRQVFLSIRYIDAFFEQSVESRLCFGKRRQGFEGLFRCFPFGISGSFLFLCQYRFRAVAHQ